MPKPITWRAAQMTHGAAVHTAKLTDDAVRAIRLQWHSGTVSQAALARQYGVSPTVICEIVHGRLWKHVKEHVDADTPFPL